MKPIVLIAAVPLALAACNGTGGTKSNVSTANTAAPEVVPDSVTVNGVTYVRAGLDKIAPAATPSAAPTVAPTTTPPPISDTGATVPPNTYGGGDASGDHGN